MSINKLTQTKYIGLFICIPWSLFYLFFAVVFFVCWTFQFSPGDKQQKLPLVEPAVAAKRCKLEKTHHHCTSRSRKVHGLGFELRSRKPLQRGDVVETELRVGVLKAAWRRCWMATRTRQCSRTINEVEMMHGNQSGLGAGEVSLSQTKYSKVV